MFLTSISKLTNSLCLSAAFQRKAGCFNDVLCTLGAACTSGFGGTFCPFHSQDCCLCSLNYCLDYDLNHALFFFSSLLSVLLFKSAYLRLLCVSLPCWEFGMFEYLQASLSETSFTSDTM